MITYSLIALCVIFSFRAFSNADFFHKLALSPMHVVHHKQQYRVFSHAFIHGDYFHLFVNMFVLWQFGAVVESDFIQLFGTKGYMYYVILYLGGVFTASLPALQKHKDNPNYMAVGASGAVAAVLFSFIVMHPTSMLGLFLIIPIPAFLLGILYLWYEAKMQNSKDNIAHDAHYWGAIYGFAITIVYKPILAIEFVYQVYYAVLNMFS